MLNIRKLSFQCTKGGYLKFSPEYEAYLRELAGLGVNDPIPPPSSVPEDIRELLPSGAIGGLELDRHTPNLDLPKLKQQGSQFVFIKVSEGVDFKDSAANRNISAASAAGLKIGLFHFFVPKDDPDKQAENFLSELKVKHWDLPPMVDCEDFPGQAISSDYADQLYKLLVKIQNESGFKPIIYTYFSFAKQHLDERFKVFPVAIQTTRRGKKPDLPSWWTDFLFWHYDLGLDDPELKGMNKIVYNGNEEAFNHLSDQLRISSKTSP